MNNQSLCLSGQGLRVRWQWQMARSAVLPRGWWCAVKWARAVTPPDPHRTSGRMDHWPTLGDGMMSRFLPIFFCLLQGAILVFVMVTFFFLLDKFKKKKRNKKANKTIMWLISSLLNICTVVCLIILIVILVDHQTENGIKQPDVAQCLLSPFIHRKLFYLCPMSSQSSALMKGCTVFWEFVPCMFGRTLSRFSSYSSEQPDSDELI